MEATEYELERDLLARLAEEEATEEAEMADRETQTENDEAEREAE